MSEHQPRLSAVKHFSTGFAIVLVAAVLSWLLQENALLRSLEMINLDVLFLMQKQPPASKNIAVVGITDEDYKKPLLFNNTSPLRPAAVADLIVACALSGAKLIAVDLDTSEWKPEERAHVTATMQKAFSHAKLKDPLPRLVWAVGAYVDEATPGDAKAAGWRLDNLQLAAPDCQGIPASVPDQYGVVRRYVPSIEDDHGPKPVTVSNIALVIKRLYDQPAEPCESPSFSTPPDEAHARQHNLLNFRGNGTPFPFLSAGTVLGASREPEPGESPNPWLTDNPLKGHAVIIGGSYRAARDRYATPISYWDGVRILAQTVASLDETITEPTNLQLLAIDMALGALLLTATWFLRPPWAPVLSLLFVPLLALLISFTAFHYGNYFISVVPVLAGILLHRLLESSWEFRQITKENRVLAEENQRLQADVLGKAQQNQTLANDIDALAGDVRVLTEDSHTKSLQLDQLRRDYESLRTRRDVPPTASSAPPDPTPHP
jgi:CHASE2 domain-containing sensor protein